MENQKATIDCTFIKFGLPDMERNFYKKKKYQGPPAGLGVTGLLTRSLFIKLTFVRSAT